MHQRVLRGKAAGGERRKAKGERRENKINNIPPKGRKKNSCFHFGKKCKDKNKTKRYIYLVRTTSGTGGKTTWCRTNTAKEISRPLTTASVWSSALPRRATKESEKTKTTKQ